MFKTGGVLDYLKFGVIAVALCGTVYLSINNIAEVKFRESVRREMSDVNKYIENQMIKNLLKQSDKVAKDPDDIKIADVEQVMSDWDLISSKTPFLRDQYDSVKNWYDNRKNNNLEENNEQ